MKFTVTKNEFKSKLGGKGWEEMPDTITLEGEPVEEREMKLAAFCPKIDCDGKCNYQSHSQPKPSEEYKSALDIIYERMEGIAAAGQGASVDGLQTTQFEYASVILHQIIDKIKKSKPLEEKCKHGKEKQWCTDCHGYTRDKPQPIKELENIIADDEWNKHFTLLFNKINEIIKAIK